MTQPPVKSEPGAEGLGPPVRRRSIFYVSGFDPQGPAHYHRLFSEQAALQSAASLHQLTVGSRTTPRQWVSAWDVTFTTEDGQVVQNHYQFLRWDDLVREHWPRGRRALAKLTLSTTLRLLMNGSWLSMCRVSWVAGLTLVLPAAVGVFGLATVMAASGFAWALVMQEELSTASLLSYSVGALATLGIGLALPRLWRFGQGDWLMRSTASLLRYARGQAPEIDARIAAWSEILHQGIISDESDEVLVVAHSSGCIAAVAALSQTLSKLEKAQPTPKTLSLLTLGQCIPVLSHQPEASSIRQALAHLSQSSRLTWVDVSAPPDACCFALSDPCASPYGAAAEASSVKRLSPRYAEQMDDMSYRELKRNKFLCHFQYLMAFQSPHHYDFFKWVCGPRTLAQTTQSMASITNFKRFKW